MSRSGRDLRTPAPQAAALPKELRYLDSLFASYSEPLLSLGARGRRSSTLSQFCLYRDHRMTACQNLPELRLWPPACFESTWLKFSEKYMTLNMYTKTGLFKWTFTLIQCYLPYLLKLQFNRLVLCTVNSKDSSVGWLGKQGRWAQLVARLLATAALWIRIQTSLKNTKWATNTVHSSPPKKYTKKYVPELTQYETV